MQGRKCESSSTSPEEPLRSACRRQALGASHCYSAQAAACQPSPGYCRRMCTARSQIMLPTKFLTSHPSDWGRVSGAVLAEGLTGLHIKGLPG